jgi:pyruvate formate lyase activating enzyme
VTSGEPTCRVFDLQRFSIHDGPGIRTTVFLEGCPLRCAWCQNPEAFRHGRAPALTAREVIDEVEKDRAFYDASGGGLTLSGGEPLLHRAPALALLEQARGRGLHCCVQTSGAVPRANLAAVLAWVDLFQLDLKHMDPERHRELTGAGTEQIHQNAAFLLEQGANVQLRMPLLPGINDDDENLARVSDFLGLHGVRSLRLVPYHRLYLHKYSALGLTPALSGVEPPTEVELERVAERLSRREISVQLDG